MYIKVLLLLFVSNYVMLVVNYAMSWAEVTTYTDPTYILIILGNLVCTHSSLLLLILLSQQAVQRGLKSVAKYWETRITILKGEYLVVNCGSINIVTFYMLLTDWFGRQGIG